MKASNEITIMNASYNPKYADFIFNKYKNANQCIWVQEEPKNMGSWHFIAMQLMSLLPEKIKLFYVGRNDGAATATGMLNVHLEEQQGLIKQSFAELS